MLRLGGVDLDTVARNTLLTALVPEALWLRAAQVTSSY